MIGITRAESPDQLREVRSLFGELVALDLEHVKRLGLSVKEAWEFVFKSGAEDLPGEYGPPGGLLLLASVDGQAAGCGAFRTDSPGNCELKRMYVRPGFRGHSVGRTLAQVLIEAARTAGFRQMRLETTTYLEAAQALYATLGFRRRPFYAPVPPTLVPITIAMELDLSA